MIPHQGLPTRADHLGEIALLVGELGVQQQPAHPDHRVQRRPDLVAHSREGGFLAGFPPPPAPPPKSSSGPFCAP